VWLLLPETARLDQQEITRAFDRHWLWRRFAPAAPAARSDSHRKAPVGAGVSGAVGDLQPAAAGGGWHGDGGGADEEGRFEEGRPPLPDVLQEGGPGDDDGLRGWETVQR